MRARAELLDQYDRLNVGDVFKIAHDEKDRRDDATEKLAEVLSYLKLSNRFKNDMKYRNSSFGEFLLHEFQIDEKKQYDIWCTAYMQYPEESKKVGPTLVYDFKKKCGGDKVPTIVNKIIEKQEATGKALPLKSNGNHPSIEKIVKPFLRQVPEKPKSTLKADLKDTMGKLVTTETVLKDTQQDLEEKEEQVNKLKKTVIEMKKPVEINMEEVTEDTLLDYFEEKIGKVFTEEDYQLLKRLF